MFDINYNTRSLNCPYCGEGATWDMRISDTRWIEVVNEFIEEHRECEGEFILGVPNDKISRNETVHYSTTDAPICGAKPKYSHVSIIEKDINCKRCIEIRN